MARSLDWGTALLLAILDRRRRAGAPPTRHAANIHVRGTPGPITWTRCPDNHTAWRAVGLAVAFQGE